MLPHHLRTRISAALVGGAFVLSACGSSGGGGSVSQTQLENKLKSESEISQAKGELGSHYNALISCVAKALKKDVPQSTLKAYVDGKKNVDSLNAGNQKKLENDATSCAKTVIKTG